MKYPFRDSGAKMAKQAFPLSGVYGLIETGPVVLISTRWKGRESIMAQSWHTMIEFDPPILACVISESNYSFELIEKSGECAINIPTVEIGRQVALCGNSSGRNADKFEACAFTREKASDVEAALIGECYASLECKVIDRVKQYDLFVMEVTRAWVDPAVTEPRTLHHRGYGAFMVAGETVSLPSEMR